MKCHISSNLFHDLILAIKLSLKGQSASSLNRIVSENNVNCRLSRPDRNTNISLKECCLSLHLSLDFHLSVSLSLFIFPSDTHTIQTQLHVKLVFGSRSKALALVNATQHQFICFHLASSLSPSISPIQPTLFTYTQHTNNCRRTKTVTSLPQVRLYLMVTQTLKQVM